MALTATEEFNIKQVQEQQRLNIEKGHKTAFRKASDMPKHRAYLSGSLLFMTLMMSVFHVFPELMSRGYLASNVFFAALGFTLCDYSFNVRSEKPQKQIRELKKQIVSLIFPVVFVASVVGLFSAIVGNGLDINVRGAYFSTVSMSNNIWQMISGNAYMDSAALKSPLSNFWLVAIAFQFLLLFKGMKYLASKVSRKAKYDARKAMMRISSIVAAASVLIYVGALVYGVSKDKTLFSIDVKVLAFAGGITAALSVPRRLDMDKYEASDNGKLKNNICMGCMLAALVGMVLIPVTQSKFAEVVIPVIYGVVSIALMAFVYKNGSQIAGVMSNKYLNMIAKRSFAFYLWHYPAVIITKSFMGSVRMPYVFMFVIQLIIAIVMAELTYVLFKNVKQTNVVKLKRSRFKVNRVAFARIGTILLAVITAGVLAYTGPSKAATAYEKELNNSLATAKKISEEQNAKMNKETAKKEDVKKKQYRKKLDAEDAELEKIGKYKGKVTFIGDRLFLTSAAAMQRIFPNMNIESSKDMTVSSAISSCKKLESAKRLKDPVVIALGNNESLSQAQMEKLLANFGNRTIYLVNNSSAQSFERSNNNLLKTLAANDTNIHLIDWYEYAKDRRECLNADNVTTTRKGSDRLARKIALEIISRAN